MKREEMKRERQHRRGEKKNDIFFLKNFGGLSKNGALGKEARD